MLWIKIGYVWWLVLVIVYSLLSHFSMAGMGWHGLARFGKLAKGMARSLFLWIIQTPWRVKYYVQGVKKKLVIRDLNRFDSFCLKEHCYGSKLGMICEMPLMWVGNFWYWCRNPPRISRRPLNANRKTHVRQKSCRPVFFGTPCISVQCKIKLYIC